MASSTEATVSRPTCDTTESEAETAPSMINLTTHMTIAPGTKCLVTCRSDIKIEVPGGAYILVSASNPTEFAAPVPTLLSPAEKLGTDFAHGWAKIPDEIRLNIMGYVLSSTRNIRWIRAVPLSSRARPGDFTMGRNLREYLGMGGELAHLALEAFYKYNTISIDVEECEERWTTVLVLPPWYVRQHIRSIVLKVICTHKGWEFLARVAQGKYGLRLVKHVVVELDTTTLTRHFLEQPPVGITFACSGDLIMHGFDTADTRWFLARAKMTEEKFISRMNSTVRFSG